MKTPTNEGIRVWMGDEKIRVEELSGPRFVAPDYLHDPAAALRVLAMMPNWNLTYSRDLDKWTVFRRVNEEYHGDTPCKAICAAWAAEFGGVE